MTNAEWLLQWLKDVPHLVEKGHRPNWYDVGAAIYYAPGVWTPTRFCVNCTKGGHGWRLPATLRA